MAAKFVYYFGGKRAEGTKSMKELLGGKGANLAEMVNLGMPVPPGFTVTTKTCALFYSNNRQLPSGVRQEISAALKRVEAEVGRKFGDPAHPLLLSVRSGAAASMPGMMDTVLNLGLNAAIVKAWAVRHPESRRFIFDAYRRFITMYADVVMHADRKKFEHVLDQVKKNRGARFDTDLSAEDLEALCGTFLALFTKETGTKFPESAEEQLFTAIDAVFKSWDNERAVTYRQINHITGLLGTAVNIQAMVFGNLNTSSATGVAFSRDPSTGENQFYGEFLINAQGEDVVAGLRTPQQLSTAMSKAWAALRNIDEATRRAKFPSMEEAMPENYKMLCDIRERLEKHYRDMQDIEFTVENGRLWMLQCRNGKRTIRAAFKTAVDMINEKLITEEEAISRIDADQVDAMLHPTFKKGHGFKPIALGLAASPGAAVGRIVFSPQSAVAYKAKGEKCLMVRLETSPEDLGGMMAAEGILTARGGTMSHAAVVARGMGKTCVSGCDGLEFVGQELRIAGKTYREGDWLSIDGSTGLVYDGQIPTEQAKLDGNFGTIMAICQRHKRLQVRANADTPLDASVAARFGAEGVGLCRTEHMFFEGNRIDAMREMILADKPEGRLHALQKILPLQREDFIGIFRAMKGYPCTIRLLDPPLHEFVPHDAKAQAALAAKMGVTPAFVAARVNALHEANPMLGHRGVRLGITFPEIYNAQVQAIIEAAIVVTKEGQKVVPEIMIPLVGKREELAFSKRQGVATAEKCLKDAGIRVEYSFGTMIEVPRAAITADEIAKEADFFSFGTNDLTQMGCGFSRDDAGPFLKHYTELGIYTRNPFKSLDVEGVGKLVRMGVTKGRRVKPNLKIGICGEHGGDPYSIRFCHSVGLNYVSCSPYRVPTAIVAAAQAAIGERMERAEAYARLGGSKL